MANAAGTADETDLVVTTVVRKAGSKNTIKTFQPGAAITLSVQEMLDIADVDMDALNIGVDYGEVNPDGSPAYAYNRLTGVQLDMEFFFTDFSNDDHDLSGEKGVGVWRRHNVVCIATIRKADVLWSSMGYDIHDTPTLPSLTSQGGAYSNLSSKVYEGVVIDRYRQGIKIAFSASGEFGHFDFQNFVNVFTQALVLLSASTTITMTLVMLAPYISERIFGSDGKLFYQAQNQTLDPEFQRYYTAVRAATQAGNFIQTFDHNITGYMSKAALFHKLHALLFKDLAASQIAQIVEDVSECMQIGTDEPHEEPKVDLGEFL